MTDFNAVKETILNRLNIQSEYEKCGAQFTGNPSSSGWLTVHNLYKKDDHPSCGVYIGNGPMRGIYVAHNDIDGGKIRRCRSIFDIAADFLPGMGGEFKKVLAHYAKQTGVKFGSNGNGSDFSERIEKTYDYVDISGNLLHQTVRLKNPKDFRQRRPDGNGGYIWNLNSIVPVLYNLPNVSRAETVIICEGEKDADTLNALGLIATTCPMGAGKWKTEYSQHLCGKKIVILPDNDEQGRAHAEAVANSLRSPPNGPDGIIKIVHLPGLPEKGDVSTFLVDQGHTIAELQELVEQAPIWSPSDTTKTPEKITLVGLSEIADNEYQDHPIIDGLLGQNESLLICGPSGLGKSLIINEMACRLGNPSSNSLWAVFPILEPVTSIIVQSENGIISVSRRLKKMFFGDPDLRTGSQRVFTPQVYDDCRLLGSILDPIFQGRLSEMLKAVEARVLFLDPLASYHGVENENANAEMRRALDILMEVCIREKASVVVVHHMGKAQLKDGVTFSGRGASAIGDWAANTLILERHTTAKNIIKVTHEKSRNYKRRPNFYLELTEDLIFKRVIDPSTDNPKDAEKIDTVLKCLESFGGQVDQKSILETAVMRALNRGRTTAQKVIKKALESNQIIIIPGDGKAEGYKVKK